MSQYDVIVVGGGPAGSMSAYHLAKAGVRVLILDAQQFPREKACGGGVQQRAAQRIPFDFTSVVRGRLSGVSLTFNFGQKCLRTYPEHLVYSVLRSEFDHLLLQRAVEAGAHVQYGTRVLAVSGTPESAVLQTSAGMLTSRYVIGADGANSVVARLLNERSNYFWQAGLYCEVPDEHLDSALVTKDMRVDWGTLPSGYAWIFPKVGSANIGVGCPAVLGRMLRPYLMNFILAERAVKQKALERLRFRGHQLPTLTTRTVLENSSVLLVGDAAGLVEPFTGDGISQACHSAEIAAESIVELLSERNSAQQTYTQKILREIGTELIWSRKLLSLAVAFPRALYRAFRINDRVWNTFCRVLRAEESFKNVKAAALGPLELLCTPLEYFVERYEKRKIDRFSAKLACRLSAEIAKPA